MPQDIQLNGEHILPEHCMFENKNGTVTLIPTGEGLIFVNGRQVTESILLKTGMRVILGRHHVFRFTHPEQSKEMYDTLTCKLSRR